jgi:ribosomal protein L14E/L6E/L27E
MQIGQIVFSKAGRDKGMPFVIVGISSERDGEYADLVDGKTRKLENPKKKKQKHIQPTNHISADIAEAIAKGQHINNADFIKAIKEVVTHG